MNDAYVSPPPLFGRLLNGQLDYTIYAIIAVGLSCRREIAPIMSKPVCLMD